MIKLYRPVKGARNIDWRMTQAFGLRPEVYGPMGFKGHMGLDYAGPKTGDKVTVYSATDGTATIGRDPKGYGNFVKVQYDNYTILYGHLDKVTIKNGRVEAMQEIGIMGTTGFSSGVHLHFEIKDPMQMNNGYKGRIDPAPYITNREEPQKVIDQDIQALIDDGIWNGEDGDGMTQRIGKVIGKLYQKVK